MFEAFRASDDNQVEGLFRFIQGEGLVEPLKRRDFLSFARIYNGSGQAEHYRAIIERFVEEFNRTVAPLGTPRGLEPAFAMAGEGEGALSTDRSEGFAPTPPPSQDRVPLPLGPEETGGKPLYEADPDLYASWRQHIQHGFENNNEMFHRILNGFMNPYHTTIWMYRVMFGIGVFSFVAAAVLTYLLRDNATTALGSAAIFGGLSVVTFLTYFVSRPLQALEENLQFITWLGIVYNTYWTRLAYSMDRKTFHADIEDATNDAIKEIERLIDKHGDRSHKRPGLGREDAPS